MISVVPGIVFWPGIIFMAIVYAARYRWCNTNRYDTYFNNTLALLLTAQLLRERNVEALLSRSSLMTVTTAQQLALAALIFASTEFTGFTMLWARLSPEETRRRHRHYRLAAVILCAVYLAAATRARIGGQTLEASGGWDAILAWSLYLTMWYIMAIRAIRLAICELNDFAYAREFFVIVGGLFIHGISMVICLETLLLAVTDQLGWTDTVSFRLRFHGCIIFYQAFFVSMLAAVPLAVKPLAYFGLDPVSRTWHKLQPLRQDMTTVVPESSFNLGPDDHRSQKTTLQLHQAVIEIRDAILRLRPYFHKISPHELARFLQGYSVPPHDYDAATHAFQLAHAAKVKTIGTKPESPDMAPPVESRATTLDEETTELLKLAKWWVPAYAAIERVAPPAWELGV